jgi:hypothetical protein
MPPEKLSASVPSVVDVPTFWEMVVSKGVRRTYEKSKAVRK